MKHPHPDAGLEYEGRLQKERGCICYCLACGIMPLFHTEKPPLANGLPLGYGGVAASLAITD